MYNHLKTILLLASMATMSSGALAQSSTPQDTLTFQRFERYNSTQLLKPFMSDSLDTSGTAYSDAALVNQPLFLNKKQMVDELSVDPNGFAVLANLSASLTAGSKTLYPLRTVFNSVDFEKGSLVIESSLPFRAFVDGKLLTQRDGYLHPDSIKSPITAPLTLQPGQHTLTLTLIQAEGEKKADTPLQARLRVRYTSSRKGGSNVSLATDQEKLLTLDFMMNGGNLTGISVSPSGRYLILSQREQVAGKFTTTRTLYRDKKPLRSLTGVQYEGWMPRQDKLYYTKSTAQGRQLITIDASTMQEEVLHPSIPEGNFSIAATGDLLVFFDQKEGPKKGQHVTRLLGRGDREGGYRQRYFLSLFDLKNSSYRPLTFGHRTTSLQDISADGQRLIFSSSNETTQRPFFTSDIMELNLHTMQVDTLFRNTSDISDVRYTARPNVLLITGSADAFDGIGRNLPKGMIVNTYDNQLFLYHRDSQTATPLTKDFDPAIQRIYVLEKQMLVYFTAEDKDRVNLYRCNLENGITQRIHQLSTKEDVVRSFGVSDNGNTIAYVGQSISNSDRAYVISGKGKEELLKDYSAEKLAGYTIGEAKDWNHTMPNGDVVQGRYYLPPHFDPAKKYPMLVYYYGGTSPVSRTFEGAYSLHMYAAQGYVVYTLNPSGSTGFGQEYAARHVNAWGQRTADEIVASVKGFCAAHPFVKADKIACMGASYGGFMTQYLQTITDIFAAAISHAGISALSSYWGEGFWGVGYSTVASADSYPWNNPDLYVRQSPLFNANKINTPLLLLHGTVDTNVPDGESVQMYNALKILGKEVEFLRIHKQDHFVLDTPQKIEWTNAIFAWLAKWLKDDPTWWDTMYPAATL